MPRATKGSARPREKRRLRRETKGYFQSRSKQTRTMLSAVTRAGIYARRDRHRVKREYRSLWITRITAACRQRGISYSRFISGLTRAAVALNRKMISELAIADPPAFDKLVAIATA